MESNRQKIEESLRKCDDLVYVLNGLLAHTEDMIGLNLEQAEKLKSDVDMAVERYGDGGSEV